MLLRVMGALMRGFDWAGTSMGSPEAWPQSLKSSLELVLNTGHPMFIWWGPDLIQFYNDAYAEMIGPDRHPEMLGRRGRDHWAEIWDVVSPQINYVMSGKGSTWDENRLVPLTRNGKLENAWWTYSYGPIKSAGEVHGVLVVATDVTARHLANDALAYQNKRLGLLFEQAPSFVAILRGPNHEFEFTELPIGCSSAIVISLENPRGRQSPRRKARDISNYSTGLFKRASLILENAPPSSFRLNQICLPRKPFWISSISRS